MELRHEGIGNRPSRVTSRLVLCTRFITSRGSVAKYIPSFIDRWQMVSSDKMSRLRDLEELVFAVYCPESFFA